MLYWFSLLVTMLVGTITTLYDFTIQLFTNKDMVLAKIVQFKDILLFPAMFG